MAGQAPKFIGASAPVVQGQPMNRGFAPTSMPALALSRPTPPASAANLGPSVHKGQATVLVGQQKTKPGALSPRNVFIGTGIILLLMICIVPMWSAMSLMGDLNYVFWVGRWVPTYMLLECVVVIVAFIVVLGLFFQLSDRKARTEQTVMMIANIFITLLGCLLMLISLPLTRQSIETFNNLMHTCDTSEQTARMYEYSQVLQNIRQTPACMSQFSVEDCAGYEEAWPYTPFLRAMESDYKCSGFCYRPLPGKTVVKYPPTLFSDYNYQASCDGMAARDIRNFAGDVGYHTFYQGFFLVGIAVANGFLKLITFCQSAAQKEKDIGVAYHGF